jgi:hypothetical protein
VTGNMQHFDSGLMMVTIHSKISCSQVSLPVRVGCLVEVLGLGLLQMDYTSETGGSVAVGGIIRMQY